MFLNIILKTDSIGNNMFFWSSQRSKLRVKLGEGECRIPIQQLCAQAPEVETQDFYELLPANLVEYYRDSYRVRLDFSPSHC